MRDILRKGTLLTQYYALTNPSQPNVRTNVFPIALFNCHAVHWLDCWRPIGSNRGWRV